MRRRQFLARCALGSTATRYAAWLAGDRHCVAAEPVPGKSIIENIERTAIFQGREAGTTWFSTRACMIPGTAGPTALMLMAPISGSDYFGPVHATESRDLGRTWTPPEPVPGLGRTRLDDGSEDGTCDMVPEYHAGSGTVLAMGHNVFYRDGSFFAAQPPRGTVYVVRDASGRWSGRKVLEWNDPRGATITTCNCAQRVTLPRGDVLIPLSFGAKSKSRSVTTVRCTFDGRQLSVRQTGTELHNSAGRGLLEPSLAAFDGRYYLTLRAEDQRGYVSTSDDGLKWTPQTPWTWDDGEPLVMSTTQQRWLIHSDELYLVYTRKTDDNTNVIRWRAPLFVALVDRQTLRLTRETEQIVVPMNGDGLAQPNQVSQLGNFHTMVATSDESWVTVGEISSSTFRGDVWLARIRWNRPNRQAPTVG